MAERFGTGEAVRIFTGAPLPAGADAIVIQEDTDRRGRPRSSFARRARVGRHIRPAGLDFKAGEVGICAGRRLRPREIGLAAAMNCPGSACAAAHASPCSPTGDEIVMPGDPLGPNQIVSSNALALAAAITAWGGEPIDLGIAADTERIAAGARRRCRRRRSADHHRRRLGRRARPRAKRPCRARACGRFLADRHAAG